MAISVTSPKPIASLPSALPPTIRTAQIMPPPNAMPTSAVSRLGLCRDRTGGQISLLGPRNSFGERGLMRAGVAVTAARAADDCRLIVLPVAEFRRLLAE